MTRSAPVLIAGLLVIAGFMAAGPALGDGHLDPAPPTDPDSGRFQLEIEGFSAQGNWGTWTTDPVEQSARQSSGITRPSFFITDGDIRDVQFRVDLETPSTANGFIGFAIHHKNPTGASNEYDTYIVDWLAHNSTIGGREATEGLTLYRVQGNIPDNTGDHLDCFVAKSCPQVEVLSTYLVDDRPGTQGRGWAPDSEYEFRIRFWGHNFPSQSGIKVDVRGGPAGDHYDAPNGGFRDTVEEGWLHLNPNGFGFFSFRQGGAVWSGPTFTDSVDPSLAVETECLDPHPDPGNPLRTWCGGPVEVTVTNSVDHGSGLANVTCFVNGNPVQTCLDAPFDAFLVDDHDARLRVEAVDHAGNTKAYTKSLRIDAKDPAVSVSAACGSEVVSGWCPDDVALSAQAEAFSPIADLSCDLNGDPTGCDSTVLEDGDYVFQATGTSAVGRNGTASTSFKRDATAPDGAMIDPIAGCVYDEDEPSVCPGVSVVIGNVTVNVLADDPEVNNVSSGYARTEFWDGDAMIASMDAPGAGGWYNTTWSPSPGLQTLEAHLIDAAGNVEVLEYEAIVLPLESLPETPKVPPLPELPDLPESPDLPVPSEPTPVGTQDEAGLGFDPRDDSEWTLEELYGRNLSLEQVTMTAGEVEFHVRTPNNLTGDTGFDNFALLLDTNNNNRSNFQVTFKAWEDEPWGYQEPFWVGPQNNPVSCGWSTEQMPPQLNATSLAADHYVITVPLAWLLSPTPEYRYGLYNINQGPQTPLGPNDAQVHMPLPETKDLFSVQDGPTDENGNACWFSSANYKQTTFGVWDNEVPDVPSVPPLPEVPETPAAPETPAEPTPLGDQSSSDLGFNPDTSTWWTLTELYNDTLEVEHFLNTAGGVEFHITTPNNITGDVGSDRLEFALDFNNNGRANFRYVFNGADVAYEEPFWVGPQFSPVSCGWTEAEPNAQLSAVALSQTEFVVTVPLAFILNPTPEYRYAVNNVNAGPHAPTGTDGLVHMPLPETLDLFNEQGGVVDQGGTPCGFQSDNFQHEVFGVW